MYFSKIKMKLKVYTANYPYGYSESFLTNELDVLKKTIPSIELIPYTQNGAIQKNRDSTIALTPYKADGEKIGFADYFFLVQIMLKELFNISQKKFFLKKGRKHFALLKNALLLAKWIEKNDAPQKEVLHYSFWMNEWALALAILKKKNKINHFVFRVNGYDIWGERHDGNYLPFRYFIYSQTEAVYALSETAVNYLKKLNYFPQKIKLAYFGTKELGVKNKKTNSKFTVFSCSSAIPLKRLDKIAKVLALVKSPLVWIHHGEGKTIENVEELLAKNGANITFQLSKKKEDYLEVLELMKKSSPDLFINLSSTEGLPVTLIEAMSFGIPLLANKVGSCHELFKANIGVLVEKDEEEKNIALKIDQLIANPNQLLQTEEIKTYWETNFSAKKNYREFANNLMQHLEE